jgi:LysR family hydrogen peroxide-inducible transcriptional activator
VHLIEFAGHPPSRRIAMVWRKSASMTTFLKRLANVFQELPPALFVPGIETARQAKQAKA